MVMMGAPSYSKSRLRAKVTEIVLTAPVLMDDCWIRFSMKPATKRGCASLLLLLAKATTLNVADPLAEIFIDGE